MMRGKKKKKNIKRKKEKIRKMIGSKVVVIVGMMGEGK